MCVSSSEKPLSIEAVSPDVASTVQPPPGVSSPTQTPLQAMPAVQVGAAPAMPGMPAPLVPMPPARPEPAPEPPAPPCPAAPTPCPALPEVVPPELSSSPLFVSLQATTFNPRTSTAPHQIAFMLP